MRAAFHVDAHTLQVRDSVPVPEPATDEVRLRVQACGFCGSDKHDFETPPRREQIPGHEFTGIVETGHGDFQPGDRVIVDPVLCCGECPACRSGRDNLCENMKVYGCRGTQPPGAFAEAVAVRARNLHRLPDHLPFDVATLVDPLAVALHAVSLGPDPRGLRCAVFGVGPIGLLALQVLARKEAAHILAIDINPDHLQTARHVAETAGFSQIETIQVDPEADPYSLDLGAPLDLSLELAGGNAPTLDQAIHYSTKGATILNISQRPGGIHYNYQAALFKELTLVGCCGQASADFAEALRWLSDGLVLADPVISHRFPLVDIQAAYNQSLKPDALKVIVQPDNETAPAAP